tara:strand:- start:758 stop:1621 length:864 start_codon:yes stop_codon:yes gene_type:complete
MSTITNTSFKGGDSLTAAEINQKFQDITTATSGALDESNFRDQAIDLAQMDSNASHGRSGIQLVSMATGSVGTAEDLTTIRNYTANRTGTPLLNAAGTATSLAVNATLSTNDILRVYFSGRIKTTCNVADGDASPNANSCWAFWLQWDITSAALANFTEVPNQGDWSNTITSGKYGEPTDQVVSTTHGIQSTAVVPHFVFIDNAVFTFGTNNVNGTYYYKNTGSNVTIYGLRLVVGGVYRGVWELNSAGSARRNYLEYTEDTAYIDTDNDNIGVYNMQIASLIMRTT